MSINKIKNIVDLSTHATLSGQANGDFSIYLSNEETGYRKHLRRSVKNTNKAVELLAIILEQWQKVGSDKNNDFYAKQHDSA